MYYPGCVCFFLYLLSTQFTATLLLRGLEWHPALNSEHCHDADAIIVLGTGAPRSTPEYPGYQPTAMSLERIRYAAHVHRMCTVPVLVSGGGKRSEAKTMADTLASDYAIQVRWQEVESLTTWQNARFSYRLLSDSLNKQPLKIILVTHSWHMARSVSIYQHQGFEVIPAPTQFAQPVADWFSLKPWIPRIQYLRSSELALHEYLGMVWYWLSIRLNIEN